MDDADQDSGVEGGSARKGQREGEREREREKEIEGGRKSGTSVLVSFDGAWDSPCRDGLEG